MKAIAYNIKSEEKECLILANHKKHDITIIANTLCAETLAFAHGKEALLVFNEDPLDELLIKGLRAQGIKFIATSNASVSHIDVEAAMSEGMKIANVPFAEEDRLAMSRMKQVVSNLDKWSEGACLGIACCCTNSCENATLRYVKLC
jgi:D-lactate dehydrogenase